MTTFDMDMARFFMGPFVYNIPVKDLGWEWPPPERITHLGGAELSRPMTRRQCSELTDEVIEASQHLARGAIYRYEDDEDDRT